MCTCAHIHLECAVLLYVRQSVGFYSLSCFPSVLFHWDSSSQLPVLLFPSAGSDLSQTSWFSCPKSETLNSLLLLCNMLTLTSNFLNLGLQRPHVSSAHFVFHFWETIFCWQVPNGLRIVLLVFQLCRVGGKLDHYCLD